MDTLNLTTDAPQADAASVYQWVTAAAKRVDAGLPLDTSGQWDPAHGKFGMPPGYDIEDGHLSQNAGNLRAGVRGAVGVGLGIAGGFGANYLNNVGAAGGAAEAGDAAALSAQAAEGSPWLAAAGGETAATSGAAGGIPAQFGWNAVDTVGSSAPAAAGAGGPVAGAATSAKASLFNRLAEKYGLDAAKGVISGLFSNAANNKKLNFENSQQDPYRGQLFQSRDVAKLDQMATGNYVASPTTITGRYAHSYAPTTPWLPSDTVRDVAAQNEASVAGGASGQYHLGDDNLPSVNYKMPATSLLRAVMAARARGAQPAAPAGAPDSPTPWLA